MRAFLDFEATSLARDSAPIEVAWVFEDGRSESHLIRPAPGWRDWSALAESVHRITRDQLAADGEPHSDVARRMVEALGDHQLYASAPTWDGKWLSILLTAAGIAPDALVITSTDDAMRDIAQSMLSDIVPPAILGRVVADIVARVSADFGSPQRHRALADAEHERSRFLAARSIAQEQRAQWSGPEIK